MGRIIFFIIFLISNFSFCLDPSKKITQYFQDKWEIKDGLPSLEIFDIKQGIDGYIWIATAAGLVRFDGINFKVFNKNTNKEFETSIMRNILIDRKGDLFVGTVGGGVIKLKEGKFEVIKIGQDVSQNYVKSVYKDKKGNYWFSTRGGLFLFNGKEIKGFNERDGLLSKNVFVTYEDRDGNFWFGTRQKGLYRYYNGRVENLSLEGGLPSLWIYGLCQDHEGILWVGTVGGGLLRLKDTKFSTLTKSEGLSDDQIWNLVEDNKGKIWIRSSGGISIYDGEKVQTKSFNGLKNINSITRDKYRNIWINDFEKGIALVKDEKIQQIYSFEELKNLSIWSMFAKEDGSLFLGSVNGQIFNFNEGKIKKLEVSKKLNGIIRFFYGSKKGEFYIGYDGGLGILNNDEIILKDINAIANSIFKDTSGNLWVGTENKGIFLLEDDKIFQIDTEKGLPDNSITAILEDNNKNLWLGSRNGILLSNIDDMVKTAKGKNKRLNFRVFGLQDGMRTTECNEGFQPGALKSSKGIFIFQQ